MDISFESQKATYLGLINPLIDNIPMYSANVAKQTIELISKEFSVLSNLQNQPNDSKPEFDIIILRKLSELFLEAELYVYPHHIQLFRALILERIQAELNILTKCNAAELALNCANKKSMHLVAYKKSIAAQNDLKLSLEKHSSSKIESTLLINRKKHAIEIQTHEEEAEFCSKISNIISEIEQMIEKSKTLQISPNELARIEQSFSNELICMFIDKLNLHSDTQNVPLEFQDMLMILRNSFMLFNGSRFTIAQFSSYRPSTQQYLLRSPEAAIKIKSLVGHTEFMLCLICLNLDYDIELGEEDIEALIVEAKPIIEYFLDFKSTDNEFSTEKIQVTLYNIVTLFQSNALSLDGFRSLPADLQSLFLNNSCIIADYITIYGLPISILLAQNISLTQDLIECFSDVQDLMKPSGIKFTDLQHLNIEQLLYRVDRTEQILEIANTTKLDVKTILGLDEERFELLFDSSANTQALQLLLNFYFIPAETLLNLDIKPLKKLLENPACAEFLFKTTNSINKKQLQVALNQTLTKLQQHLKELSELGYLNQIKKIINLPRSLINETRDLGLDFLTLRCLYDILVTLNQSFANAYLSRFMQEFECPGLDPEVLLNISKLDQHLQQFATTYAADLQSSLNEITSSIADLDSSIYNFLAEINAANTTESVLAHCQYRAEIGTQMNLTTKDLAFCNYAQLHARIYPATNALNQYNNFMQSIKENIAYNVAKPSDFHSVAKLKA